MHTWDLSPTALLLVALIISCSHVEQHMASAPLTFRDSTVKIVADTCSVTKCSIDDCGGVHIVLAVPNSEDHRWKDLRRACLAFYANVLEGRWDERDTLADLSVPGRQFVSKFGAFLAFHGDVGIPWTVHGQDSVLRSDSLICIYQQVGVWMSGGHAQSGSNFVTARARDGALISWSDLVVDSVAFHRIAETAFRDTVGMRPNDSYAASGYWEVTDKFELPEQIGLDSAGFILEYQPYEIGSYAMGAPRLYIPFSKVFSP